MSKDGGQEVPRYGNGEFSNPIGVATDAQGFVYVADYRNSRVQKFDAAGSFITKWGSPGSGPRQFRKPIAIAVDAQNNVSVLDAEARTIQKFSPDGTTYLGSWGGRSGVGDGEFSAAGSGPGDLVIDPAGNAYVSDTANHRVQRWRLVSDATGALQSATFEGWIGRCTSGPNCDIANQRSNGFQCTAATCSASSYGSGPGQFGNPSGLTLDAAGNLYVTDTVNNRLQQFNSGGAFVRQWGTRGTLAGEFRQPIDVAAGPTGDLYVADSGNERVQKFSTTGMFLTLFGGSIALSVSLGYPPRPLDALVDPNPLFVFRGQQARATVAVTSVSAFSGPVTLSTRGCCEDLVNRSVSPGAINTAFSSNPVTVAANGSVTSVLTISTPAAAQPGRFLIPLAATNLQLGVGTSAGVAAEILAPVPSDRGSISPCVPGTVVGSIGGTVPGRPEMLPLSAVTTTLFTRKVSAPARTSFGIGATVPSGVAGWVITVARAGIPLRPDQAVVVLSNATAGDTELATINSANCGAARQTIRVARNESASVTISAADTTTLLLSRSVCRTRFLWCWDWGWDEVAIFDEGAFWTLFGGRQVTINWFFSRS